MNMPLPEPASLAHEAAAAPAADGGKDVPVPQRGARHALADLVLSPDRKQRLRITRSMTSMLVYVACVAITMWSDGIGLIQAKHLTFLQIGLVSWILFIYIWLRSGLNERMKDPALTLPQIIGAQVWITASYITFVPFRGSVLMLLCLVLVFGIFNLDKFGRRFTNAYTVTLIGAAMLWSTLTDPQHFPPLVEAAHFLLVATILPVISMLGGQFTDMRTKLKRQRAELQDALQRIHEMAVRDELTGLFNRRHMLEMIDHHVRRMRRANVGFCLCLIDLDHFKRVNDTYGHGVGDEVLRAFAAVSTRTLRDTDVVARWGGEEFLILLPETRLEQAAMCVQRIRASLAETQASDSIPGLRATFSAGITEFVANDTIDSAIERADRALYSAKSAGRDRACLI